VNKQVYSLSSIPLQFHGSPCSRQNYQNAVAKGVIENYKHSTKIILGPNEYPLMAIKIIMGIALKLKL
jgi:hypothetical protein